MIESEYDGQFIAYVDPLNIVHTGFVVGQTPDRQWLFVQSDNPNVPDAPWHFKVLKANAEAFIQTPAES